MLVFILSSCILACLIFIVSYLLAPKALYNEKVHGYECGFIPYGTPRVPFEIHFYIVSILFIVFDLEIVYLVPWVMHLNNVPLASSKSVFIFVIILVVGLIYEWSLGVLRWKRKF